MITPDDEGYDGARSLYFSAIDRRPAAIVQVAGAQEIARVLAVAREAGIPVAVRNGGHSVAGHALCDGGLVIDIRQLRSLEIDAAARVAQAGAGITAGAYTTAVGEHGLATSFGDAPSVAVGGITLAGGIGFLHRRYGMTIDHVLGAEVVTGDGEVREVDAQTHPDLFWAIRGGGGNFGVVTRFTFRLNPVDQVLGGMMIQPASPAIVADFVRLSAEAPDELSMIVNIMPAPPMPFVPAEHHGKPIIAAMLVYAGDPESGQRALAPFRALATPLADMVRPMRYPQIYEGDHPHPAAVSIHTRFIDALDPARVDAIFEQLQQSKAPMRTVQFRALGGAVARVANDATAFAHRQRAYMMNVAAMHDGADAAVHDAWVERTAHAIAGDPDSAYVGFMNGDGAARIGEAYPAETGERLARIKAQYDPDNLFRFNQNIRPAGVG